MVTIPNIETLPTLWLGALNPYGVRSETRHSYLLFGSLDPYGKIFIERATSEGSKLSHAQHSIFGDCVGVLWDPYLYSPKVCKTMAFQAIFGGCGLVFYMLLGSRYGKSFGHSWCGVT